MKGVFLDFDTVSANDLDDAPLRDLFDTYECFGQTPTEQVAERVAGADVVLLNKVRIGRSLLESVPELRFVTLAATGFDNIDLAACRDHGVGVANIKGYCTPSVVQHVFALLLHFTVHLDAYRERVRRGDWERAGQFTMLEPPIRELAGHTMGIIGHGELGSSVARLAGAFGMEVLVADRPGGDHRPGRVPLEELLPAVDVLSLHCPLTDDTRHLIGAAELAAMRDDAVLINTSRGAVVDEAALADALRSGKIGGAGIDVLSEEPPVNGNPLLDDDIPNLVVTPHVAWGAREARQRALEEMAANVTAWRAGEARNRLV